MLSYKYTHERHLISLASDVDTRQNQYYQEVLRKRRRENNLFKITFFQKCLKMLNVILSTKIYKIINFPNMCSNIPASPAYGVYISQLIRYARASSNYSDFLKRHLYLRNRLLDQGYTKIRLIRSLKKFIFRYQDLVKIYSVSAETIINDGFHIVKMYKDKEVNKNVKNIFLSMCDVNMFLTFTFVVKILQVT